MWACIIEVLGRIGRLGRVTKRGLWNSRWKGWLNGEGKSSKIDKKHKNRYVILDFDGDQEVTGSNCRQACRKASRMKSQAFSLRV